MPGRLHPTRGRRSPSRRHPGLRHRSRRRFAAGRAQSSGDVGRGCDCGAVSARLAPGVLHVRRSRSRLGGSAALRLGQPLGPPSRRRPLDSACSARPLRGRGPAGSVSGSGSSRLAPRPERRSRALEEKRPDLVVFTLRADEQHDFVPDDQGRVRPRHDHVAVSHQSDDGGTTGQDERPELAAQDRRVRVQTSPP